MAQGSSLKIAEEPDWERGGLYDQLSSFNKVLDDEVTSLAKSHSKESDSPLQQSDLLKPFLLDISNWGLNYAYHKYYGKQENPDKYKHTKTTHPINVIIIGAGMSRLVAGYEHNQYMYKIINKVYIDCYGVSFIESYFDATMGPIMNQLRKW